MKKIALLSVIACIAFASCKRTMTNVSEVHPSSVPYVIITGPIYYSIGVGDPLPSIVATAYDTFYDHSMSNPLPVIIDNSTLDNTTPGLYAVTISAKNQYGMVGTASVYIGVTSASPLLDLSGWYIRNGVPERSSYVAKLGNGLFMTSNAGGADTTNATTGPAISAVFVVTSDTTIDFGSQLTAYGQLGAHDQVLSLAVGDTVISYLLDNGNFSPTVPRIFHKI